MHNAFDCICSVYIFFFSLKELQPQRETSMARTPTQSLFRVEKLKTFEMTVTVGTISIP